MIRALKNKVLIHNIEQGEKRTKNGIIILDDNGKERGWIFCFPQCWLFDKIW